MHPTRVGTVFATKHDSVPFLDSSGRQHSFPEESSAFESMHQPRKMSSFLVDLRNEVQGSRSMEEDTKEWSFSFVNIAPVVKCPARGESWGDQSAQKGRGIPAHAHLQLEVQVDPMH